MGVIKEQLTANITDIAKILGSIPRLFAKSIAIGVNNTAHALFDTKLVVKATNKKKQDNTM